MSTMDSADAQFASAQAEMDAFDARFRDQTHASLTTPTVYKMTGYRGHETWDGGVEWSGIIKRGSKQIGSASNNGTGMGDIITLDDDEAEAFIAEATRRYGDPDQAPIDPHGWLGDGPVSMFVNDLATRFEYNRKRCVQFTDDTRDLTSQDPRRFLTGATMAQAVAVLTDPARPYAAHNPMVWNKTTQVFVPADDIEV